MEKVLIGSMIFLASGILMRLFQNFKSILLGYGTWKITTPKHLKVANVTASNVTIAFSLLYLGIAYLSETILNFSFIGLPSLISLITYLVVLFLVVNYRLDKLNDTLKEEGDKQ